MVPASDLELVERVRAGDAAAMEPLVRRHNQALYRTARAILRDDRDAEDAVQDAYIQAFRGLAGFRAESSVSTWLTRIAANEALMRLRRRTRYRTLVCDDDELLDVHADEAPGPEGLAMNAEARRILEERIDALPDLYRTVFVLRAVQELSVEETAAALELPEATVRTRLFRARALLRDALAPHGGESLAGVFAFDGARCDRIVERVLAALAPPALR